MSPCRVVTVASNKGGVGKTTLATNLCVYLRALHEDVPVLLIGLDDQELIDRMFSLDRQTTQRSIEHVLEDGELDSAIRLGQYGVHFVPSGRVLPRLRAGTSVVELNAALERSDWNGLVVIDTKSDLGVLTQNALAASDLVLLAVADQTSLDQADRIYELLEGWGRPRETARIVLSLVDLRVKFREGTDTDVLALLISEIRRRGHPLFQSFVSRSPKIESLVTNPGREARTIMHGARGSLIDRQMASLAEEVARVLIGRAPGLAGDPIERRVDRRRRLACTLPAFRASDPPVVALSVLDLSSSGIGIEAVPELAIGERLQLSIGHLTGSASNPEQHPERFLLWARVERHGPRRTALRFELGEPRAHHRLSQLLDGLPPQDARA